MMTKNRLAENMGYRDRSLRKRRIRNRILTINFLILLLLTLFLLFVRNRDPNEPAPSDSMSSEMNSGIFPGNQPDQPVVELTDELEILDLLMRQDPTEYFYIQSKVEQLLLRKDAMGFYANLFMAEKARNEGTNDILFIENALHLYEDNEARMDLADRYLASGDMGKAHASYYMLLPNEVAYQNLVKAYRPETVCNALIEKQMWEKLQSYVTEHNGVLSLDEQFKETLNKTANSAPGETENHIQIETESTTRNETAMNASDETTKEALNEVPVENLTQQSQATRDRMKLYLAISWIETNQQTLALPVLNELYQNYVMNTEAKELYPYEIEQFGVQEMINEKELNKENGEVLPDDSSIRDTDNDLSVNETPLNTNINDNQSIPTTELQEPDTANQAINTTNAVQLKNREIVAWLARCSDELGKDKEAIELYQKLGSEGAAQLGALHENNDQLSEAAKAYAKSQDPKSMWRGAQIYEEKGQQKDALKIYLHLVGTDSLYRDDAAYRAYILLGREKETQKQEDLIDVLNRYPSMMVRLELDPVWPELLEAAYKTPEFITRMETYQETGREAAGIIEQSIGYRLATQEDRLALGDWRFAQGDLFSSVIWGIRAVKTSPERRGYTLAYPKPYAEEVMNAAKEFSVDPFLIWAVIREESTYRPDIRSGVGAIGLMQVMPSTAKEISASLKFSITEESLNQPAVNIRFGTYYLRKMLDRFHDDTDQALAAYNGGAGNVNRWMKSAIMTRPEDFPTAITFYETREYISKVMNSYHTYQWLYDNESGE